MIVEICLNERETKLFNFLNKVVDHFHLKTQLRIAGGWVRDKLLGKDSNDIDVAIDNMLGRQFCDKINDFLLITGEDVRGFGNSPRNPDQSKHLETATMCLFDVSIDFVNLRVEDYSENTRIPTMRFGNAKVDAYRRDLTINSLFYNINSNSIEDFTGRGIIDLKLGKIVTPLPPKTTLLDDPLRVLRAIRFGARYNFVLDDGLKEAAASDEVRIALAKKISRERIGHEVDLMIGGNEPVKAMTYICDLQLFWSVFTLPYDIEFSPPESFDRLSLSYIDAAWRLIQSLEAHNLDDEQRRLYLYAAFFLPIRNRDYRVDKKKKLPAVDFIFRNSLKHRLNDAKTVISVHRATEKCIQLFSCITTLQHSGKNFVDITQTSKLRLLTGLFLREIKELWPVVLLVSTLLYPDEDVHESVKEQKLVKRKELFKLVKDVIFEMGLENIWEAKPLLDGNDIMRILNLKAGPWLKEWQQKVIEWQLTHPTGTPFECEEWLKEAGAICENTDFGT